MGARTLNELILWNRGAVQSAYLAQALIRIDGAEDIDPIHPRGGRDGGKDILCTFKGVLCVVAVYFPNESNKIKYSDLKSKFRSDAKGAARNGRPGFLFVTNVHIRAKDRKELEKLAATAGLSPCILFHLERVHAILDSAPGYGLRRQYLEIPLTREERIAYDEAKRVEDSKELRKLIAEHKKKRRIKMPQVRSEMESILSSLLKEAKRAKRKHDKGTSGKSGKKVKL